MSGSNHVPMTPNSIAANGKILDLTAPRIMGILNLTPDSFFDGGRYQDLDAVLKRVASMIREGADIIDIGGMSSRPGAAVIPAEEEYRRIMPALKEIRRQYPDIWISVDTVHSEIARAAAEEGSDMINDISAGTFDDSMFRVIGEIGLPYILMHMQGMPDTMQQNPQYDDVIREVLRFLLSRVRTLRDLGVRDLIVDPGIGFGKSVAHNYQILEHLEVFRIIDAPLLIGLSRKSMICKVLHVDPKNALNGTTALHMIALRNGARILRVHDVRQAREVILLHEQLANPLKTS